MADHVFISYAHVDKAFVHRLAERLEHSGIEVWIDKQSLHGGADWEQKIEDALYDCAQFLIVLSPAAVSSKEVRGELRAALNEDKPILPVLYQECRFPLRLQPIQYVDYSERGVEDIDALQELLQALAKLRASAAGVAGVGGRRLLADRREELALFQQILDGKRDTRILLVESEGGMGKSTLLGAYEQLCCHPNTECVPVDLKSGQGLADVLALLGLAIGWPNLPNMGARVAEMAQSGPGGASASWGTGRVALQAVLQVQDEQTRSLRRTALTEALFADLRASPLRRVFVFDTLNDADPEVREWLLGSFLTSVRYSQNIVTVVAGRPPLKQRTTWAACCECIPLREISDPKDWLEGLRDFDSSLVIPLTTIQAFCVVFEGHPLQMRTCLDKLVRAQGVEGPRGGVQ